MNPRLLTHLQKLVDLRPYSSNQPAVRNVLEYVSDCLEELSITDIKIHQNNGIYSLTASTQHTMRPKVLLQAHVDVVPAPEDFVYKIEDDKVYGRGVFDMLFALASYLVFLEDHKDTLHTMDIGLMLTGDEEIGGVNGVKALLAQGYGGDVCILPDAGAGFGDLNVAAKGLYNFTIVSNGVAHHGSRPWEGDGAANKLVHLLSELMQIFDDSDQENSTLTVTKLNGGDATNKGPRLASAHVDIRFRDQADFVRIQSFVKELMLKYNASIENLSIGDCYEVDLNDPHIQQFLKLYQTHVGQEITMMRAPGTSDAPYLTAHGIPTIMLRPDGYGAHGDSEWLSVDSFNRFHALLDEYIVTASS